MTKRTIEIDDDPAFQRKEGIAQRVGIGVLALFLFAAVLGFTGSGGPFSRSEVTDPSGALRIEYERIVRRGAKCTLRLHLQNVTPGPSSFWISAEYFDSLVVEAVVPNPATVTEESGRYVFTITSGASDVVVTVEARSRNVGRLDALVGVVGGPSVQFHQTSLF